MKSDYLPNPPQYKKIEKEFLVKNKKIKFLLILIMVGIFLSIYYYFYLHNYALNSLETLGYKEYPQYGPHYYDYYMRSVVLCDSLKSLNFDEFFLNYFSSHINKIYIFRSLPFFLIFGSSQFVYIYSNYFFNFFLLILVYLSLTKIFIPKRAFIFSIFLISNFAAVTLFVSPYTDLTFMFACSLFYIHLYLFKKDFRKNNLGLGLSVLLLFLTKTTAYVVVFISSFIMILYFLLTKNILKKYSVCITYSFRYILIVLVSIIIYFKITMGPHLTKIIRLDLYFLKNLGSGLPITLLKYIMTYKEILFGFFYERILVLIFFISLIYLLYKRKKDYWIFLLFISQIYLLLSPFSYIKFGFQERFLLPVYFIHLLVIFQAFTLFMKNYFKSYLKYTLILVIMLLSFNLFILPNSRFQDFRKITYYGEISRMTEYVNHNVIYKLPPQSKIIIVEDGDSTTQLYDWTSYLEKYSNFHNLTESDNRFAYKIVADERENYNDFDYVLHDQTYHINASGFKLVEEYDMPNLGDPKLKKLYLWKNINLI